MSESKSEEGIDALPDFSKLSLEKKKKEAKRNKQLREVLGQSGEKSNYRPRHIYRPKYKTFILPNAVRKLRWHRFLSLCNEGILSFQTPYLFLSSSFFLFCDFNRQGEGVSLFLFSLRSTKMTCL